MNLIFVETSWAYDRSQNNSKVFKSLQKVFFRFLHISKDPYWVILSTPWKTVFRLTLGHKAINLVKHCLVNDFPIFPMTRIE